MPKRGVPDRWKDYSPLGRRLPGTRFIAFKVPLQKLFETKLHPAQVFTPSDLVRRVEKQKETLGKIIDLTCTNRYYNPEELPEYLHFEKIFTAGHAVPNPETISHFKQSVSKYLQANAHNDKLIGVHCTHGVNRTGYLICRYLIDVDGMEPRSAIELFNRSRGHHIERKNYIDDLLRGQRRRSKGMDSMPPPNPPGRPGHRRWAGNAESPWGVASDAMADCGQFGCPPRRHFLPPSHPPWPQRYGDASPPHPQYPPCSRGYHTPNLNNRSFSLHPSWVTSPPGGGGRQRGQNWGCGSQSRDNTHIRWDY